MNRRWLTVMIIVYVAAVAVSVLGPNPGRLFARTGGVEGFGSDDVANIVMFVPYGLLFPSAWPRLRRWTIPLGLALSVLIELVQLVVLSWRTPSLIDVLFNSVGAALGYALWHLIRARIASPKVEPRLPDLPPAEG